MTSKIRQNVLRAVLYPGPMAAPHIFTDHPNSVGETYGEHARFALRFAGQLAMAAGAAAVHAVRARAVWSSSSPWGSRIGGPGLQKRP